jgi:hypothetical protein
MHQNLVKLIPLNDHLHPFIRLPQKLDSVLNDRSRLFHHVSDHVIGAIAGP